MPSETRAYVPAVMNFANMFTYAKGGVHEDAAEDRQQMLGILKEKGLTKSKGGRGFAKGGASADDMPSKAIPGKSVLRRAPHGKIALPVMHIMIAAIPKHKGEGKARGGTITIPPERQETRARRPAEVPPVRGKTPRGVGKALRGWGKTGR